MGEIRKGGAVDYWSSLRGFGYTPETLRSMRAAGYMLYKDGRRCQID